MADRAIGVEDIKRYFDYSKEIADRESTLYESVDQLSQEELKIDQVVAAQNRIRFDENENDLFREQLETVITILADGFKGFGFAYDLYFDLVYNLLLLEYEKLDRLSSEKGVAYMLDEIGITDHLKTKVKALLDHEDEMTEGCGGCGTTAPMPK
jgi:hypothetical protein